MEGTWRCTGEATEGIMTLDASALARKAAEAAEVTEAAPDEANSRSSATLVHIDDATRSGVSRRQQHIVIAMGAVGILVFATVALLVAGPLVVRGRAAGVEDAPSKSAATANLAEHAKAEDSKPVKTASSSARALKPARKLVIDVDAGSDDAMGILVILGEERRQRQEGKRDLEVLAVTCTHGNTPLANVERNVLKTLHVANRLDIPVYSGASESLITTPPGDNYFGMDGFGDFEYQNAPQPSEILQKEHAVNALIRLAKENPGEITLLALGPLTNVALATRMDPEFLNNLQQVIIMGGDTEGLGNIKPATEFNFYVDPEADFIVFNSSRNEEKPIFILPWDSVAARNLVTLQWRRDILGGIKTKLVDFLNKAERYQLNTKDELWISADPIASAIAIRPELITASEQHHVDVEMHGDYGRGVTFVDYNNHIQPKNTVIVKSFDVESYKKLLLENLGELL